MRGIWTTIGVLTITACTHEQYAVPPATLPARFVHRDCAADAARPDADWYRKFENPSLDALVASATGANLDMQVARERVHQADARARQAGAALMPSVDAVGSGTYYAGHSSQGGGHEFDWSSLLMVSYEFDFWGKNRAAVQSAEYLTAAARAERDTVELTTLAAVAATYFETLSYRERLRIATANRDTARQLLDVVQARFNAGAASPVELATETSTLASAQITLAELRQAEAESLAALALLLGQLPEEFTVEGDTLDAIKEPAIGPGLPSQLLQRRPDVFLAEANLRAAHADVTAARASLFPNLSLTAGAGIANPALPATVLAIPGVGPLFLAGGSITQPIFDRGKLKAQRDEVKARESELIATYRASIVAAFKDVENALGALEQLNQTRAAQELHLHESERAFAGAKLRYEAGSGEFLSLLEAQRTVYSAREQFVQYRLARLLALVSLDKALGGGWSAATIPEPTAMNRP